MVDDLTARWGLQSFTTIFMDEVIGVLVQRSELTTIQKQG